MEQERKIFISHSTKNQDVAHWLVELLRNLGVTNKAIFCSSSYRNGVHMYIKEEVFQALQDSEIDIIVMSNEYKASAFCLNEAGVIYFKGKQSDKLVIALPEILNGSAAGVIDKNIIQLHLLAPKFFEELISRLKKLLINHKLTMWEDAELPGESQIRFETSLREYIATLPILDNLTIPWIANDNARREQKLAQIAKARDDIMSLPSSSVQPQVFYKRYARNITIYPADDPGMIKVKTETKCVVVNCSDKDHAEEFSAQFLAKNGGHDTFTVTMFEVNNKPFEVGGAGVKTGSYIEYKHGSVIVKKHSCTHINHVTTYEIQWDLFFQSKVLSLPCGSYTVSANFAPQFAEGFGADCIFRNQIIPPNPHNKDERVLPNDKNCENNDKHSIHYQQDNGFPTGGGYVITINKQPAKPEDGVLDQEAGHH